MKRTDELPVEQIRLDGGTQSRAQINMAVVAEYAEEMQAGAQFPRPTVFHDGQNYWLVDGFHRLYAHKQAFPGYPMWIEIQDGTQRDAVLASLSANATHGLRRTNADKRRAVETLLRDSEWVKWSNSEIGRKCGVSEFQVRSIRTELESSSIISKIEGRTVVRNGQTYTQSTGSIGKSQPKPETKKSGYPCWTCGEVLDSEQWHRETCDNHWPVSVNHCATCYAAPLLPEDQPEEAAPLITDEFPIESAPERPRMTMRQFAQEGMAYAKKAPSVRFLEMLCEVQKFIVAFEQVGGVPVLADEYTESGNVECIKALGESIKSLQKIQAQFIESIGDPDVKQEAILIATSSLENSDEWADDHLN